MNTPYLDTLTLKVLFRYIIFSRQQKFSVYVFICLHCLLTEAAAGVEVFVKKDALKNFVNLTGNRLC